MTRDRLRVRRADSSCIRGEAPAAQGAEVLGVGIEQVLTADLASGVEEREAHPERDLEERALLSIRLGEEPLVDRRELRRSREALCVVTQVRERALEPLD